MRRRSTPVVSRFPLLAAACAFSLIPLIPGRAAAASPEVMNKELGKAVEAGGRAGKDLGIVAMPIPLSNPAVGTGLGVAALALYTPGRSARPWSTGIGGVYTENDSWGAGVFQRAYLGGDRVRLTGFAGTGEFNLKFYGVGPEAGDRGVSVPIKEGGDFAFAQALLHIAGPLHAGPALRYLSVDSSFDLSAVIPPELDIPPVELNSKTMSLGLVAEYDTRDSEYGAHRGVYITGQYMQADDGLGGDFDFHQLKLAANAYLPMPDDAVIAWRAALCDTGDGAPFYELCMFGQSNDLRGYPTGQYRDHSTGAIQVEYRRDLFWKFGMTAFAGVGGVGPSLGDIWDTALPAVGVGLRFEASEQYGVNVSIDYAAGDGSDAVYFYIGEAF